MSIDRSRLPDAPAYFEREGLSLVGRGKWKTAPCPFHGGGDSLRVNTESGGWICMSCGEHGGDILAFHMQMHGVNFVQACRDLGCWVPDGKHWRGRSLPFSARDGLEVALEDITLAAVIATDMEHGKAPSAGDC